MQSMGLLDLQVNGFAGIDFNAADLDADALEVALAAMLGTGVTTCLPTIITASAEDLARRLAALDRAVAGSRLGPIMVPGYHLEGPFLNPADGYAGCHPPQVMTEPDADLVFRLEADLSRPILLVTLAPEMPGSEAVIQTLSSAGKIVAVGHSSADTNMVSRAVEAGAEMSTHLGNGVPQTLPKLDNTIFAQLAEERLHASFIADGIHLPRPALKAMLRAKGIERSILVTDAVSAAAARPGRYSFAGMAIEHGTDGSVRLPGSRYLAGSSLTLDKAIGNIVRWGLGSPEEAIQMACDNPRSLLARALRAHGLPIPAVGHVSWSADWEVLRVEHGDIVHRRK
ncbi:N-acetylglucosamine-6-phosphate deacetylase [Microvirga guangxiensis]|uniref:N-acetylglucosamine-6-phosphate deacetylase n=1 Tax=Microvirga guangxiensis TaxID=549386 RepID=A0A1G5LM62_9HYPH|nr:N-acetylglucosamine-6-phosphate deacetylase [Microvirga guangxiensis]SCZ13952.1 N-acetylglucosamine-6-phosphate deacetylase [Microvirga guangxiensis]